MMTTAELENLQRTLRQMLPDLGIGSVLTALKKALPEQTLKYNAVFQLETRLNSVNRDRIRGVLSQEDLDIAYNRISADILDLVDGLVLKDFDVKTAESNVPDKEGSILYRIPHTMEVEEEYRCIVRLAFDVDSVIKNIEITSDTVVKDVRVSEVMEVELVDPNATPCFAIRKLNSVEQFLEKNEYTEWIFFVKPLVTGELPLVLKVSVKELINEKERIKEIVLEEVIKVIAEPTPDGDDTTFQNAGYVISYSNAPENQVSASNSKPKAAMLLVVGLMIASGILAAGMYLGYIPTPDWLLGKDPAKDDRVFWEKMSKAHTRSSFENYILAYPDGQFVAIARQKIDSLRHLEDTLAPPPAPPIVEPVEKTEEALPANTSAPASKPKPKPEKPKNPANTPHKDTQAPVQPPPAQPPAKPAKTRKSGFDMVAVQGGNFNANKKDCSGNPLKIKSFKIGKYEITQADWREIMGRSTSYHTNCSDCPVESVSWDEIQRFLTIAAIKHGKKYRLPYEIEWEYAARGGQNNRGMPYAGDRDPNRVAWFNAVQEASNEVGSRRPNELGIFDMSGNVWEWCEGPYPAYLPCTPKSSKNKPLRGGSWADGRNDITVEARRTEGVKHTDRRSGFRIIEE